MGLRGETVGTAYVRIIADGKGLDKSIQKEMEGHDKTFKTAGESDAVSYNEGFGDEVRRAGPLQTIFKRLLEEKGRIDAIGELHGSEYISSFERALKRNFGEEIGSRLGMQLRDGLRRTMDTGFIDTFLDSIGQRYNQVVEEIATNENHIIKDFERDFTGAMDHLSAKHQSTTSEVSEQHRILRGVFDRTEDAIHKFMLNGSGDIKKVAEAFDKNLRKMTKRSRDTGTKIRELGGFMQRFSDHVGTAFGRGSRNNFLNFFGSLVRNLTSLPGRLVEATGTVINFAKSFGRLADGSFSIGQAFKQILGLTAGLAGGIALVAGTLALIVAIAGPLAALLSGLAAAFIGLAGAVGFAAVNAFAALLPLILPVAAIIGGITLAIQGLDKHMKNALKNAFEPFMDVLHRMQDIAADNIFQPLMDTAPALTDVFRRMIPLVDKVTESLGKIPGMFVRVLQAPVFDRFLEVMETFLPDAVEQLGQIMANVFRGMTGLFIVLVPYAEEFLGWLEDITEEFANFTGSRAGRKELKKFFDDASESASVVWEWIRKIGKAIGKLLGAGRESGNTIFEDMNKQLDTFLAWLDEHPDALKDFFENGIQVARDVGQLVKDLGELFDELDSEETRKELHDLMTFISGTVDAIAFTFGVINQMIGNVQQKFSDMGDLLAGIWHGADVATKWLHDRLADIGHWFEDAWNFILRITTVNWNKIIHAITDPVEDMWNFLFGHSVIPDIVDGFRDAWNFILNLTERVWGKIEKFIVDPITNAFSFLRDKFIDIKNFISNTMGNISDSVGDKVDTIVGFFRSIPGRIRDLVDKMGKVGEDLIGAFFDGIIAAPDVIASFAHDLAEGLKDNLGDFLQWIVDALNKAIPNSLDVPGPLGSINLPDNPIELARGGIINDPRFAVIGEDGPEAVVPLNRPLSQVDPAVRALSALAQGLTMPGSGKTIEVGGITIVTPTEDPVAVATETVDQLAVTGYF